jgi:hypothetical protein
MQHQLMGSVVRGFRLRPADPGLRRDRRDASADGSESRPSCHGEALGRRRNPLTLNQVTHHIILHRLLGPGVGGDVELLIDALHVLLEEDVSLAEFLQNCIL